MTWFFKTQHSQQLTWLREYSPTDDDKRYCHNRMSSTRIILCWQFQHIRTFWLSGLARFQLLVMVKKNNHRIWVILGAGEWNPGTKYVVHTTYITTYHSRASECLKNIRGTDLVVFVLILFPQMSNNLQLYLFLWLNHRVLIKLCVLTIRTYVVL